MILIPTAVALAERHAFNGARGDSRDPLYIDAAQCYLIGGKPWTEPLAIGPVVRPPALSGTDFVAETRWIPVTIRPGCAGFAWQGRLVKLHRSSADNPNEPITLDCYEAEDLSTEINLFQSVLTSETVTALPGYECDDLNESEAVLRAIQGAPIVGPSAQWLSPPPEVPTPGLLQLVPVAYYRTVVLKLVTYGIGIGWLQFTPLVSATPLADLATL